MKKYFMRRVGGTDRKYFRLTSQTSWFLVLAAVLLFDFLIIKAIVEGLGHEKPGYSLIKNAFQKESSPDKIEDDENYQNALVKEIVSASDTGIKLQKTISEKLRIMNLTDLKKFLKVNINNYRVIASGGIDELELTISNHSTYFIDAVTVQVDYLIPKGQLVQTESFTTTSIKPNSSKTIHIPSNSKGSKVEYRITNVQAAECKLTVFDA